MEGLLIESETLILLLASSQSIHICPSCAQVSSRVYSSYRRRLADLPCQGRAVQSPGPSIFLRERGLYPCQTLAEQFPEVALAYARQTLRQAKTLC